MFMDNNGRDNLAKLEDAQGIFKTLYLFLLNHNFQKAADALREEWKMSGNDLEKVASKPLFLTSCKCSNNPSCKSGMKCKHPGPLDGFFYPKKTPPKPDEPQVFYVCNQGDVPLKLSDSIKQILDSVPSNEAQLKLKFARLQEEHQKLIAVTSELTSALQTNIIGQTKNIEAVLEQCKNIYPSLFQKKNPPNGEIGIRVESNEEDKLDEWPSGTAASPKMENLQRVAQSPSLSPARADMIRCVLETVLERVFDAEKQRGAEDPNSPSLNKKDLEKIVSDVINKECSLKHDRSESKSENSLRLRNEINDSFYIDYSKLKFDLIHSDEERTIRLLQALRWKITKNDSSTREKIIESYVANDVLDLSGSISIPERLLLGHGSDYYVQESTCRLVNAMASLRIGRDYLTRDDRLLKRVLIRKVKGLRSVSGAVVRNMLIASIQKLSIRKPCRIQMVSEGLFEVVVDYLNEFYEILSKYCLEYCSALLMNLCLVEEAKTRAAKNPKKIIGLVKKFLDGHDECYLPYINGVMFSLFVRKELVNEALNQKLDRAIMKLIQVTTNENLKKQLDFILQSRLFGDNAVSILDEVEDNNEEVDLLELELDQDDFITDHPSGEKLLHEYTFSAIPEEPSSSTGFLRGGGSPESERSFSEDIKQFIHKPSAKNGIFETAKAKKTQNFAGSAVRSKPLNKIYGRFPTAPICYMENCQKLQGGEADCPCSSCKPGQSKYYCGCYETIRQEVDDNKDVKPLSSLKKTENKSSVFKNHKARDRVNKIESKAESITANAEISATNSGNLPVKSTDDNKGGRKSSGCKVCGEKKCECAFESRPKLCRTPTL